MRRATAAFLGLAMMSTSWDAAAYRPFDGTDADVAGVGEFELELGPSHFYTRGARRYIIAPATVLNLGLANDLELVADFKDFIASNPEPREPSARVLDTDLLLKWVFRRGRLQNETGLSMALEAGPWIPEIHGETGMGAQTDFIVSYRFCCGTVHLNEQAALTRAHRLNAFSSVILEGSPKLTVRPVTEVFAERTINGGSEYSALVGAIWSVRDSLALDLGLRAARVEGATAGEVRLGFTWAFPVWAPSETARTHPFPGASPSLAR